MSSWRVIGISGVTCGGKSSLVRFLKEHFPGSISICQDDYFLDQTSNKHVMIPELNHQNWERLEAVDWESMMSNVQLILGTIPPTEDAVLFVEGHIIYNYRPLERLFHRKYFLTLTKDQCYKRRSARTYDPPDPPGYFEMCVWPMYLSNKAEVEKNDFSVVYLDGSIAKSELHEFVLQDIKNYLSKTLK